MLTEATSPAQSAEVESSKPRGQVVPDWLAFAIFALVTVRLALRAAGPVTDPDTWWHLRLGEEFRGHWSLANPGQLSPFATRPWFATQWTLEILASYLDDAFGLAGVAWLAGAGVVALAVALYVSCRQRASVLTAAFAASMALVGTSLSQGPRPQLASFVFVALFTTVWLRTTGDLKPRWWLVPLTWLWACTHGMWFIGVLIGLAVVVGLLLDHRLDRRTALRLGAVPIGGLFAAALTPVGPKLLLAPFATSKMAQFVTEWQPPKFTELVPALAMLMVALVVIAWARGGSRRSFAEILLLGMAVGWIVLSYRTVAVGVVIAAPLLAGVIESLLPRGSSRRPKWETPVLLGVAFLTLVGLAVAAPSRPLAPLERMDQMNQALNKLPEGTVVYNDYALGGWLEWKHRNVAPVIDGMTDGYQVSHMTSYMNTLRVKAGWRKRLDKTGADYALLARSTALRAALEEDGWEPVVQQSKYVLLRRGGALD